MIRVLSITHLYCTVLCSTVLRGRMHVAPHHTILHHITPYCTTLRHVTLHLSAPRHTLPNCTTPNFTNSHTTPSSTLHYIISYHYTPPHNTPLTYLSSTPHHTTPPTGRCSTCSPPRTARTGAVPYPCFGT